MNLIEMGEESPLYQLVEGTNGIRHYYHFLNSMIEVAIASDKLWLSESLIKAINFHAIVALHPEAGRYRPYRVTVGEHTPPPLHQIEPLMEEFVNITNRYWDAWNAETLAAYVLWRINYIHPFVNGNGRTARAVCYFVICGKSGGLLPGPVTVPEILRTEPVRAQYDEALRQADEGNPQPLIEVVREAIDKQLA